MGRDLNLWKRIRRVIRAISKMESGKGLED